MIVATPNQLVTIKKINTNEKINTSVQVQPRIHRIERKQKKPIADDKDLSVGSSKVFKSMINLFKEDDKYWTELLEQQDLVNKVISKLEM